MGMFDSIIGKNKQTQIENERTRKEKDFIRENQIIDNATSTEQSDYSIQEGRTDLLKWQQDFDEELEKLKHRLRSEVRNENGQWERKTIPVGYEGVGKNRKVVYQYLPPLANELFIDHVETLVEPFLSRNMFSSNFNEKRILEMLKNTCNDITDNMADGWDRYEIDFVNYDIIMRLIKNVIIPGPFRALNDGQRRHDRTIAKRIEAFNERQQPRKSKSILGGNVE